MTQLFDRYAPALDIRPDAPHVKSSATSTAAAAELNETKRQIDREKVYRYIAERLWSGATREEIGYDLGMMGDTVRPRVVELMEAGRIIASGRFRKTRSGRDASVLIVHRVEAIR